MKVYTLEYFYADDEGLGKELIEVFDSEKEAREYAENRGNKTYFYDYVIKEFDV